MVESPGTPPSEKICVWEGYPLLPYEETIRSRYYSRTIPALPQFTANSRGPTQSCAVFPPAHGWTSDREWSECRVVVRKTLPNLKSCSMINNRTTRDKHRRLKEATLPRSKTGSSTPKRCSSVSGTTNHIPLCDGCDNNRRREQYLT